MNKSAYTLLAVAAFGVALAGCDMPGSTPAPKTTSAKQTPSSTDLTKRQRDVMDSAKEVQGVVDAGEEARRKQLDAAESK
ncbi:MAG: hypothetical protein EXR27_10710 [Betaproteobacteria bacterium]|nr:hypothetical protein [Betaproteobacteria bacterium]